MKATLCKRVVIISSLVLALVQNTIALAHVSDTALQQQILANINKYRSQHGMRPLTMDQRIVKEAEQHSVAMAQHKTPVGHEKFLTRINRLRRQIKNSGGAAENVAYNYKDAQTVVNGWIHSSGHRANIRGDYNLTGIGIARDQKGRPYFTQIFLKTGGKAVYASRGRSRIFVSPFLRRG